jgi:Flp pilus assembly protein CpaB
VTESLMPRVPEPVRTFLRTAGWHRRLLAAGCAAAAVAFGLTALAPKPPDVARVLAAAHNIPAGSTLSAADVRVIGLPRGVVPVGALRAGTDVLGRVVAGPLRDGEPLTDVRLVGAGLFGALDAGLVATPVRIADPGAARLLDPGDIVDVLAASEHDASGAPLVASGARVLVVPAPEDSQGGIDDGALVVLATTPATAALLARAAVSARLSVVIRSG